MAQHRGVPGLPMLAPPPVLANVPLPAAPLNYRKKYRTEVDVTNGQYTALLLAAQAGS